MLQTSRTRSCSGVVKAWYLPSEASTKAPVWRERSRASFGVGRGSGPMAASFAARRISATVQLDCSSLGAAFTARAAALIETSPSSIAAMTLGAPRSTTVFANR